MEIRSDRGQNLNLSAVFKELYRTMKIKGKPASLRHLRKVRLTPAQLERLGNKDQWHEAEVLGQVPGTMVIVNTPIIGFNVGRLVRTQDDYVVLRARADSLIPICLAG